MDEIQEILADEEFKEDIDQFETTMTLNYIQSFERKKKSNFQKNSVQPSFDLMTLFQLHLYNNPQNPIKIPDSDFLNKEQNDNNFRLENKSV